MISLLLICLLIPIFLFYICLQVKVNVMDKNDSPPTFRDLPTTFSVSEDLGAGQIVASISATDPDTIGKLEYSTVSGDDGKFILEKDTGVLKLRDTLDRETKDLYKLVIRVTDGVQYTETTIAIQVSENFSISILQRWLNFCFNSFTFLLKITPNIYFCFLLFFTIVTI